MNSVPAVAPVPVFGPRAHAGIELAAFLAIALGSKWLLSFWTWRYAAPITLVGTLVLITLHMHRRGERWSDLGLRPLPGWRPKLMLVPQTLLTLLFFGAAVAISLYAGPALGLFDPDQVPQGVAERWGDLPGHPARLLMWLGIVWASAAFGEEMFFRAFLITRVQRLFAGFPLANVLAVLLPALLFGWVHVYYQGMRGAVTAGLIGVAFGSMYLLLKRNLWPLVILHGLVDSVGFLSHYFQWDA